MKKFFTRKSSSSLYGFQVGSVIMAAMLYMLSFQTLAQESIVVGGTSRNMIVYAPSGLAQNRPLLISMHGLNQDPNYQRNQAKWELVADTAKFVVVYPQGINNSWDIGGTRDVNFLKAIIDDMYIRYKIDRNRVYVSGFSMGGMMTYHAANNMADKIAAIGPVSGYLFGNTVSSSRPLPIIHAHGTADDVVYYNASGNQQGVLAMLQKWRDWNKCPSTAVVTKPYPANRPSSQSSRTDWKPCDGRTEITLLTLDGKGHWHSNDAAGVHTTIELWNFLRRFSLSSNPIVTLTSPAINASYTAPASIALTAAASASSGSIVDVKFYNGNTLLNTDNSAPYSYNWTNVAAGTYTIRVVATDNQGRTGEATVTIKVNVPQGPYNGTWHIIPGTIQLENYDVGGNGIAYMDSSPGSETAVAFRADEDVDLENCIDAGAGYNIGYGTAGEWLEYSVDVQKPGSYDLDLRVAANGDGRTVSLALDGVAIANNVIIPNTGGWQIWQTVTVKDINLKAGKQIMRVTIGATDYVNINFVNFTLTKELKQEPFDGIAAVVPGRIEAEDYDLGGEGLAYHEANTTGNEGGADYRNDEVDIEITQDTDGGYNVAYILQDEWLEYTVIVASTVSYDLDIRVAADGDGKTFHIEMDGVDVTGSIAVPNTGGWQTWQTVTLEGIELTAGEHVMRIVFESSYMNLNYVEFNDVVTGVNRNLISNLNIFPNPMSEQGVEVKCPGKFSYRITDMSGTLVESGYGSDKLIAGKNLSAGTYILTVQNEKETQSIKILRD